MFAGANIVGGLRRRPHRLWTDFNLDTDGTVRLLMQDAGMSARQTADVQRLLEIHTTA